LAFDFLWIKETDFDFFSLQPKKVSNFENVGKKTKACLCSAEKNIQKIFACLAALCLLHKFVFHGEFVFGKVTIIHPPLFFFLNLLVAILIQTRIIRNLMDS